MKIEKINNSKENDIIEGNRFYVYDGEGCQYIISLNKFGELEIQASDGSVSILPRVSNEIVIKTNK